MTKKEEIEFLKESNAIEKEYSEDFVQEQPSPVFFCCLSLHLICFNFLNFCSWFVKDFTATVRACESFFK